MGSSRLLVLTYHFPPSAASGSFRLIGFSQHLPKFGWTTAVVSPECVPGEPVDAELLKQVPPETNIYHSDYPSGWVWKPFLRFAGKAVWLPKALASCISAISHHRPQAVLTSGPPHCVHLLGLLLKRIYRLPWIADFRDPWVRDLRLSRPSLAMAWGERAVLRNADLVIANAPQAGKDFAEFYPRHRERIVTLTNGFDTGTISAPPVPSRAEGIRILHAGEIYTGRDPRPYLDAVRSLGSAVHQHIPHLQTRFIGRIECKSVSGFDLQEEIQTRGLGSVVTALGQISHRDALAEMQQAQVLLLLDTPGRLAGVPAKLYEYFGAGRPVLALAEPGGDVATILKQSGVLHRLASPRDVGSIQQALAELAVAVRAGQPAVVGPEALRRFTRESIAQELASHLNRVTQRHRAHSPAPRFKKRNRSPLS